MFCVEWNTVHDGSMVGEACNVSHSMPTCSLTGSSLQGVGVHIYRADEAKSYVQLTNWLGIVVQSTMC